MFNSRVHIQVGDLVILYMNPQNMAAIIVTPGEVFHNKYGRYQHNDLTGVKYGSKILSPPPHSGYVHLLRPTPELWTLSLPHRTQIVYMPDIAYIIMRLGVRVGGTVIEAGTGSGSMTHSLARAVGMKGKVQSYEYHRARYEKALIEFQSHGLTNVHLEHRNVCKEGFGDSGAVEAVFLDLPAPWDAIPHAVTVLRPDMMTKVCCFSPCLEQVLRTVSTLRSEGFSDISTQEVLVRSHEIIQPHNFGPSHLLDVSTVADRLRTHERHKEERRVIQMRAARERSAREKEKARAALDDRSADLGTPVDPMEIEETEEARKTKVEAEMLARETEAEVAPRSMGLAGRVRSAGSTLATAKRTWRDNGLDAGVEHERSAKRARQAEARAFVDRFGAEGGLAPVNVNLVDSNAQFVAAEDEGEPWSALTNGDRAQPKLSEPKEIFPARSTVRAPLAWSEAAHNLSSAILTRPAAEMRGHTSYLTFASLYPVAIRTNISDVSRSGSAPGDRPVRIKFSGVARVAELAVEGETTRAVSEETEYGSDSLDAVMGTLTEEEMMALQGI